MEEPKQPEAWKFVDDLKSKFHRKIIWNGKRKKDNEADLSKGVSLDFRFPDTVGLLDTAYADFRSFLKAGEIKTDGKFNIITDRIGTESFEAYKLEVGNDSCKILANDTEGIRRGLVFMEDEILRTGGPFLKIGITERDSFIKTRISRCFFGPIKRPPLNRDELMDDEDYYPEEYLNRLVHEGINGLWLTVEFKDLCRTSVTPGYGKDSKRRLAKLRLTVEKCLRYGIKIYIFCIEPEAWMPGSETLKKYPELGGADLGIGNGRFFCPFSDMAKQYLYESVNQIFKSVPGLGGMINISHGERATTCLSSVPATENRIVDCPVCSKKKHWEIIYASLSAMEKGMHDAAPEAQLISWLYMPQAEELADWVFEIPAHTPENVTLQFNFESGGIKEQLGKSRIGADYWQSYAGPSGRFRRIAESASVANTQVSAKIQVGVSHEVGTVPFVPVPGILFRKYREMRRLKVSAVMQCWYFGNYPGLMNKAAGELAFEDFRADEKDFLMRLAAPEWVQYAGDAVTAWTLFSEAYSEYPFSVMFQRYGPMHDGAVWPLYVFPAYKPLAQTWLLEFPTSGDFIGECLKEHTIAEVLALCKRLSVKWNQGVDIFKKIGDRFRDKPAILKEMGVAEALGIHFECGYGILRFYALRERLFNEKSDKPRKYSALDEMEAIVHAEIHRSGRLLELCESDSTLGFHSEAEGYKYFPEKLKWRIKLLENLLRDDFPTARESVKKGQLKAIPSYMKSHVCNSDILEECGIFRWKAYSTAEHLLFHVECDGKEKPDQIFITLASGITRFPVIVDYSRTSGMLGDSCSECSGKNTDTGNGWRAEITVPFSALKNKSGDILGLSIVRFVGKNGGDKVYSWEGNPSQRYRNSLGFYQKMGVLHLNRNTNDQS